MLLEWKDMHLLQTTTDRSGICYGIEPEVLGWGVATSLMARTLIGFPPSLAATSALHMFALPVRVCCSVEHVRKHQTLIGLSRLVLCKDSEDWWEGWLSRTRTIVTAGQPQKKPNTERHKLLCTAKVPEFVARRVSWSMLFLGNLLLGVIRVAKPRIHQQAWDAVGPILAIHPFPFARWPCANITSTSKTFCLLQGLETPPTKLTYRIRKRYSMLQQNRWKGSFYVSCFLFFL